MTEAGFFATIARDLSSGKGQIRLIVQPIMAMLLGVRVGVRDAKLGKAPFFLRLVRSKEERHRDVFRESLRDGALPICVAVIVDGILQRLTLGYIRPVAALVVGALLAWVPFVVVRALANRAWRRRQRLRTA